MEMMLKEYKSGNIAKDLEATQLVSLDDLKELEQLQLVHAAEPAGHRRAAIAAGIVLSLVLAAALIAVVLMRSGGHF